MFEFPIYIPIKTLDPGSENIMWTVNPNNQKKYFLALADKPTIETLQATGFNNAKQISNYAELLEVYSKLLNSKVDSLEGVVVFKDDFQQYLSLRSVI